MFIGQLGSCSSSLLFWVFCTLLGYIRPPISASPHTFQGAINVPFCSPAPQIHSLCFYLSDVSNQTSANIHRCRQPGLNSGFLSKWGWQSDPARARLQMCAGGWGHCRQAPVADAAARWKMDENINWDATNSTSSHHQSSSLFGALMEPRPGGRLRGFGLWWLLQTL